MIYQGSLKFTRAWSRMGLGVATPLILSELTVIITNPDCRYFIIYWKQTCIRVIQREKKGTNLRDRDDHSTRDIGHFPKVSLSWRFHCISALYGICGRRAFLPCFIVHGGIILVKHSKAIGPQSGGGAAALHAKLLCCNILF